MKRFLLAVVILLSLSADAAHIKGGFFTYQYLGPGSGTNLRYRITLTVYMLCTPLPSTGQLSNPINFSIFDPVTNQLVQNPSVSITSQYQLSKVYDEPCITGDQRFCYYYIVVYDLPSIELPATPQGYLIAYQRCCRIPLINNLVGSGSVGNTFTITIPGTAALPGAETNSSPVFPINDTAVVCRNSYFQYSFQATDADGDSLSYSFCDAYSGGSISVPAPNPATNPPYASVPYQLPFSGNQPMGAGVVINQNSGIISGIAPDLQGQFVLCVCVNEYRNGVLISTTRKELHVEVGNCDPLRAQLNPTQITCDGFNVNFANLDPSNPSGTEYLWTFGDPASGANNSSTLATPSHVYTDTGVYNVKLKVSIQGGLCADSAIMRVLVYPGFFPGFIATGNCFSNPFTFTDTTNTRYGEVNTWSWNFGDLSTLADTSRIRNPQYTFPNPGTRDVQLIVTNSKGCIDTANVSVNVLDKPPLSLPFNDTLICSTYQVVINATGTGQFTWTGPPTIVGANTSTITVSPATTSWYYVNLNDIGCVNRDSVRVRVIPGVSLLARADTTICEGDAVQLSAATDGLSFSWTPAANINNPNILNPVAVTYSTTTYTIVSSVGSCNARDSVVVRTVPYPVANAGPDPIVCFNGSIQLNGVHDGSSFTWTPTTYLSSPAVLNPVSSPPRTTQYILSSFDTTGCPKPGRDTVVVTILPRVRAYAGRDTSIVVGQPLQLNGTGGISYLWIPSTGLSNPNIANPVGVYTAANDTIRYKLIVADAAGCADSAFVVVRIFQVKPTVFVPTAFTPNNDGRNDVVRPISVGIERLEYFSVFNRWGQLVYKTTVDQAGWDGRINGRLQDSGVFVWMVSAVDYSGNKIFLKGTVALIR